MRGRGRRRIGSLHRLTEQQLEPGAEGAELGAGRERDVDLQAAGEQEHAIDRGQERQVEEMNGAELALEVTRPLGEEVGSFRSGREPECEVEVRPAIAAAQGQRPHHRARDHATVRARHLQQPVAHAIALLDAEHGTAHARDPSGRRSRNVVPC